MFRFTRAEATGNFAVLISLASNRSVVGFEPTMLLLAQKIGCLVCLTSLVRCATVLALFPCGGRHCVCLTRPGFRQALAVNRILPGTLTSIGFGWL